MSLTDAALGAQARAIRLAERSSPHVAAALALPLFMRVGPRLPIRDGDRAVHQSARRSLLRVRGRDVVAYEWGTGPDTILLVHGWRGRASQFAPIVRELRAAGFRLLAFDAPANGESAGRRTDVRDWLAAIELLQSREGRFHTVIGHSFGAMASAAAIRNGASAGALVAIAGMADARYLVDSFAARLGVGTATADALADRFARRILPHLEDPWPRFDSVAHPLPERMPLLVVHDRGDREVAVGEAVRLHAAHGDRSRLVLTEGAGHSRILGADAALDAVTAFVTGGTAGIDALGATSAAATRTP
ncbi:alpha/beta superfamily hydrolase [Agromyces flavus]|uniref:Alpha/beta hydrolase family protein n=1 Tax=Agromyces flavus TaxID=589382 RepID=A0A1H1Z830_9MICO|nr:alpha/beta hydrolase [Agromyces flavus]MCP2366968.1 alpha/beta superfamily hydrolase [Agromyces flavus]GGI46664.1 alpha/beta hydrolase [Agromyces flavus]SDT29931.1 Alpha/beta hydrolase family protein [Agromyces flavus]